MCGSCYLDRALNVEIGVESNKILIWGGIGCQCDQITPGQLQPGQADNQPPPHKEF